MADTVLQARLASLTYNAKLSGIPSVGGKRKAYDDDDDDSEQPAAKKTAPAANISATQKANATAGLDAFVREHSSLVQDAKVLVPNKEIDLVKSSGLKENDIKKFRQVLARDITRFGEAGVTTVESCRKEDGYVLEDWTRPGPQKGKKMESDICLDFKPGAKIPKEIVQESDHFKITKASDFVPEWKANKKK
jgi:hypothetical protein